MGHLRLGRPYKKPSLKGFSKTTLLIIYAQDRSTMVNSSGPPPWISIDQLRGKVRHLGEHYFLFTDQ